MLRFRPEACGVNIYRTLSFHDGNLILYRPLTNIITDKFEYFKHKKKIEKLYKIISSRRKLVWMVAVMSNLYKNWFYFRLSWIQSKQSSLLAWCNLSRFYFLIMLLCRPKSQIVDFKLEHLQHKLWIKLFFFPFWFRFQWVVLSFFFSDIIIINSDLCL